MGFPTSEGKRYVDDILFHALPAGRAPVVVPDLVLAGAAVPTHDGPNNAQTSTPTQTRSSARNRFLD